MTSLKDLPDSLIIQACEEFMSRDTKRNTTDAISAFLKKEIKKQGIDFKMTREQVYKIIQLARDKNYFIIAPPEETKLTDRLVTAFDLERSEVTVVNVRRTLDQVAASAAQVALDLIQQLAQRRKANIHLGMGGGWTTMRVARHLGQLLRTAEGLPKKLTIHALSTGFDVRRPHTAPISFFSFFQPQSMKIDFVGLFAPAVIPWREYRKVKNSAGVREAFEAIPPSGFDLVITSLGSASHEHGDFNHLMSERSQEGHEALVEQGWVGDVQYRPFSAERAITANTFVRTITLLEISDLIELAGRPDKHVLVVAGPCGHCGGDRADAVFPLINSPDLKLWSRFVMDLETAEGVLQRRKAA